MSLADDIAELFEGEKFTLDDVYNKIPDKPKPSIRSRIYDKLGIKFKRLARGVYQTIDSSCIVVEGDGRDLSSISSNSIDCIITDHPWEDAKSNIGGARKFTNEYECFKYNEKDFIEKVRVLKPGSFLAEVLPAENENNYEYLYNIKQFAKKCGLMYYAKVPWKKGTFVSNTGRKAKNTEEIMIFSKGKARSLRLNTKKTKSTGIVTYMSGTSHMLPAMFDVQAVPRKQKIHQSEKPVELYEQLLEFLTVPGEIVLDQFAGSGALGEACLNKARHGILIEKLKNNIEKIKDRLNNIINQKNFQSQVG